MSRKAQSTQDLLDRYIKYFNRNRNAGIERIGRAEDGVFIRYRDGRDVALGDNVLSWVRLFKKLNELHPRK